MDVQAMRRVDGWIGAPLCALLTLIRRLTDPLRRSPVNPPHKILVLKLAEQGATVVAYSALRRATELVGSHHVYFAVFAENRFILDELRMIPPENVIEIRTSGLIPLATDTLAAIWRCWRERVDSAVDFEYYARFSAILGFLSGASRRVGFHSFAGEASYRGDLLTHRLVFNPFLHASQVFRVLVEALTIPPERLPAVDCGPWEDEQPPLLQPASEELRDVQEIITTTLGGDSLPPLILINANTGDLLPLRRWPRERYVELARRLLARYPEVVIGLTGSPSEARSAQSLADDIASDRCVSFGGKTTLRQLLVLYFLSEVMVTNDSGPAHYANLTPIDVITLFGPETPAAFGSRSRRSHLFWAGLPCSPCINAFNDRWSPCRDNICMQRISVDEVYERLCEVYEARRGGVSRASGYPSDAPATPDPRADKAR